MCQQGHKRGKPVLICPSEFLLLTEALLDERLGSIRTQLLEFSQWNIRQIPLQFVLLHHQKPRKKLETIGRSKGEEGKDSQSLQERERLDNLVGRITSLCWFFLTHIELSSTRRRHVKLHKPYSYLCLYKPSGSDTSTCRRQWCITRRSFSVGTMMRRGNNVRPRSSLIDAGVSSSRNHIWWNRLTSDHTRITLRISLLPHSGIISPHPPFPARRFREESAKMAGLANNPAQLRHSKAYKHRITQTKQQENSTSKEKRRMKKSEPILQNP